MTQGTVLKWLKEEEETVKKGDPVVLVFGEKTEYEVEAPETGILLKKLVNADEEVPVRAVLGVIGEPGDEIPSIDTEEISILPPDVPETESETPVPESIIQPEIVGKVRINASPAAKRTAKEHGIKLSNIQATGPRGRIIKRDVEQYITQLVTTKRIKETIAMSPMRKIIAQRMSQSFQTAPHIWIQMEADMGNVVTLRKILLHDVEPTDVRISYTDILIKSVADAIRVHPRINSTLEGDQIQIFEDINIGLAIQAEHGLIVPVIPQVDQKSVSEIARTRSQIVKDLRDGTLPADALHGGTFTVTNLGTFGVDSFLPIINPPEVGILAVGQMVQKPVAVDGKIEIRSRMVLTLAVDHRVIDGAPAAKFLATIKRILENPYLLKL